jgi:hypothetical protein
MKTCILLLIAAFLAVLALTPFALHADHGFFPIYNITHLKTTEGDAYNFYSPGFNYTYNAKKNFGFFSSIGILFPLRSSQNGEDFKNADFYKTKLGMDLLMGAGGKVPIGSRFMFVPSGGAHLNIIRLRGKSEYLDLNNVSTGIGLNLQARYAISRSIDCTLFTSGSWDGFDLIHRKNKFKNGLGFTVGAGLTF